jgi:beta-galactosidase
MNLGAPYYFTDPISDVRWLPQNVFRSESAGVAGGYDFKPRDRGVGTDKGISGTDIDPVFQSARVGIRSFKVPVLPGQYSVTFYFAEIEKEVGERVFDVLLNGRLIYKDLDIAKSVGKFKAWLLSIETNAEDSIEIEFRASKGEAILNAIQIIRKW